MSQLCSKCQRVNPGDAVYCYWDGALLQGTSNGGPVNPGVVPFPSAFVFPSGQSCQNFDQLAMACQNNWKDAVDLLRKGFLGGFFGGLGRADLAMAAQEASQFPDQDRGLDQLLSKIPSRALDEPKLKVEPQEINLGTVPMAQDRSFEIRLANQGMRLLCGSIASDSKWLTIGDGPGLNQKIFQFRDEIVLPVQIRGKELRAGPKALEGHLFLDSNGSKKQVQINVRVEVPVKPLQGGVLAGATTPRQVAEKAKAAPKEAAVLFENGTVARWFTENGWIYPVQGPSASGIGAVQQFFEALGLAKAPKVTIDKQSLTLQGAPGQPLQATLEVKTEEKRPVYAHATANAPWVDVSQVKLAGRSASIVVRVPTVPYSPGQILSARIRVHANGNQRFEVPLNLTVLAGPGGPWPAPVGGPMAAQPAYATPAMAYPAAETIQMMPSMPAQALPAMPAQATMQMMPMAAMPVPSANISSGPPMVAPVVGYDTGEPFASFATGAAPATPMVTPGFSSGRPSPRVRKQETPPFLHLIPLLVLIIALAGASVRDLFLPDKSTPPGGEGGIPIDPNPLIGVGYDFPFPEYQNQKTRTMRFGVWKQGGAGQNKLLTYDTQGKSNSTVIKVDGKIMKYADPSMGVCWTEQPTKFGKHGGAKATWTTLDSKIKITQEVEKIPGDPFIEDKKLKRAVDTCQVTYIIENADKVDHLVGLRFLLDTYIGDNDGVPFTIADSSELVDTSKEFPNDQFRAVPDFIQALERIDLSNPGVVARLKLQNAGLEKPDKIRLTLWPGADNPIEKIYDWDVPLASFNLKKDSSVAMYWNEKPMRPGDKRVVGFTYGLVHLAKGTGDISATYSGELSPNKPITITALITAPKEREKLTLKLPEGLKLTQGTAAKPNTLERDVPASAGGPLATNPNPVYWTVTAANPGNYVVTVSTSKGKSVELPISIASSAGIFGGS